MHDLLDFAPEGDIPLPVFESASVEDLDTFIRLAGQVDQDLGVDLSTLKPSRKLAHAEYADLMRRKRRILAEKQDVLENRRLAMEERRDRTKDIRDERDLRWERLEAKLDRILDLLED